jgi:hypothetical protein
VEGGTGAPWGAEGEPSSEGGAGAEGRVGEVDTLAARAEVAAMAAASEGSRAAWRDDSPRRRPSPLADDRLARAAPSAANECGAPEKVAEARARYLAAWAGHPRSPAHGQGHARQCDPPARAWSAGVPRAIPRSTFGCVCDAGVT